MMMTWRCYSCEWIQIWFLFSYVRAWWGEGGSENIRENGMKGKVELCTQTTWICFYFPSSSKLTFCLQQNKTKNVTTKQKHPQSQSWKSTERLKCSLKNQRAIRTYKERNPSSQWNDCRYCRFFCFVSILLYFISHFTVLEIECECATEFADKCAVHACVHLSLGKSKNSIAFNTLSVLHTELCGIQRVAMLFIILYTRHIAWVSLTQWTAFHYSLDIAIGCWQWCPIRWFPSAVPCRFLK